MSVHTEVVQVSSLQGKGVDVDAFINHLKDLAHQKGLAEDDIGVEPPETFPIDAAIPILLTFSTAVAYDIWKEFILPELKQRYRMRKRLAGK